MVVQAPPPAGRRWNRAESTPEPASDESEETITEAPRSAAPSAGAVSEPVGAVASKANVRLGEASAFPTPSTARARTVYDPSSGKAAESKAYVQLPAASAVSFQSSEALEKPEPSQ